MKINFFDNRGILYVYLHDRNERARFTTGLKTPVDTLTINRYREAIQNLYDEKRDIHEVKANFRTPELAGSGDILVECLRVVEKMRQGIIKSNRGKPYSPATCKTYHNSVYALHRYGKHMKLQHVDMQLPAFLKQKIAAEWKQYFTGFERWMAQRYAPKSMGEIMNQVGVILNIYAKENYISLPSVPKLSIPEKASVVLPPTFVSTFLNDPLYGTRSPEMETVWEVCATILISTMRISDALSFCEEDIRHTDTGMQFHKKLQKTGWCQMPIPKRLADIYRKNLLNGNVYTIQPDKELIYNGVRFLMSGYPELQHNVTENGVTQPMWMWVTPHMLRKTAITSLIYHRVDHHHVRHASGHSANSKAFWGYVKIVDKYYQEDISTAHERMGISS